jgi:hypothetical protein
MEGLLVPGAYMSADVLIMQNIPSREGSDVLIMQNIPSR